MLVGHVVTAPSDAADGADTGSEEGPEDEEEAPTSTTSFSPTLQELSCNLERLNTQLLTEPDTDAIGLLGYDLLWRCWPPQSGEHHTVRAMRNVGNTCYINALLAALSAVPSARAWCKQHLEHHASLETCLPCKIGFDLQELSKDAPWPFKPLLAQHRTDLNSEFRGRRQQCAPQR